MGDYYQQEEGQQVKRELVIDAANERNYNNEDVPHSSLSEIMNPSNTEPEDDTTLEDIGTMLDEGDIPLRAQRIMQEYFQNSTPTHYDAGDVVVESCACDMDDRSYDNIESFEN